MDDILQGMAFGMLLERTGKEARQIFRFLDEEVIHPVWDEHYDDVFRTRRGW